jgi:Zn-dependent protease with chaperone function
VEGRRARDMIDQIRSNNRKIIWGTATYVLMVVGLVILFGFAMFQRFGSKLAFIFLVVFVALEVCIVYFATRSGMHFILKTLKAIPVSNGSLLEVQNAVDNIVMASGLTAPELMYIDDDSCNAFSLKRGGRRMIFFTAGLVEKLEADELTAVIGHEMAHLHNEDAAMNAFILSLSGFSMLLGNLFRQHIRSYREDTFWEDISTGFKTLVMIFLYALLLALLLMPLPLLYNAEVELLPNWLSTVLIFISLILIGLLLALLLGAVMRKFINPSREMLADALCVKWTMDPEALARALMEASTYATRYKFKALRATLFIPCHFSDPQPSPKERIAYLEDTMHMEIG